MPTSVSWRNSPLSGVKSQTSVRPGNRGDRVGYWSTLHRSHPIAKLLDDRTPDQPGATDYQRDVTGQSEIHADEAKPPGASAAHRMAPIPASLIFERQTHQGG